MTPGIIWQKNQSQKLITKLQTPRSSLSPRQSPRADDDLILINKLSSNIEQTHARRNSVDKKRLTSPIGQISKYPPFEDLVNFAKQETTSNHVSHLSSNNYKEEIPLTPKNQIILSTKSNGISTATTSYELCLQILLEEQEETISIHCDFKDKVQSLYRCIFGFTEIKTSLEDAYGLFHPTQRQRIPPYVTIKALNVSDGDLLIFKNILSKGVLPKKKRTKKVNFLRKSNYNKWIGTITPLKDQNSELESPKGLRHTTSLKPATPANSYSKWDIEINLLKKFINWLEQKNGELINILLLFLYWSWLRYFKDILKDICQDICQDILKIFKRYFKDICQDNLNFIGYFNLKKNYLFFNFLLIFIIFLNSY